MNVTSHVYLENLRKSLDPEKLSIPSPNEFVNDVLGDETNSTIDSTRFIDRLSPWNTLLDVMRWTYYLLSYNNPFITLNHERYIIDTAPIQKRQAEGYYNSPMQVWTVGRMFCEWVNEIHENLDLTSPYDITRFQTEFNEIDRIYRDISKHTLIDAINVYYVFAGSDNNPTPDGKSKVDERYFGQITAARLASEIINPEDCYTTDPNDDFLFQVYDFLLLKGMDPMVPILTYRFTRSLIYGAHRFDTYYDIEDPGIQVPCKHDPYDLLCDHGFDRWILRYLLAMYYCVDPTQKHLERIYELLPHYQGMDPKSMQNVLLQVCQFFYLDFYIDQSGKDGSKPVLKFHTSIAEGSTQAEIVDQNLNFVRHVLHKDRTTVEISPEDRIFTDTPADLDALVFYLRYIVTIQAHTLKTMHFSSTTPQQIVEILFGMNPYPSEMQTMTFEDLHNSDLNRLSKLSDAIFLVFGRDDTIPFIEQCHRSKEATDCRVFNLFLYLGLCKLPSDKKIKNGIYNPEELNIEVLCRLLIPFQKTISKDEIKRLRKRNLDKNLKSQLDLLYHIFLFNEAVLEYIHQE